MHSMALAAPQPLTLTEILLGLRIVRKRSAPRPPTIHEHKQSRRARGLPENGRHAAIEWTRIKNDPTRWAEVVPPEPLVLPATRPTAQRPRVRAGRTVRAHHPVTHARVTDASAPLPDPAPAPLARIA